MTDKQKVAYVIAQSVCAFIKVEGMKAANSQHPEDQLYDESDFNDIADKFQIHHNAVVGLFHS